MYHAENGDIAGPRLHYDLEEFTPTHSFDILCRDEGRNNHFKVAMRILKIGYVLVKPKTTLQRSSIARLDVLCVLRGLLSLFTTKQS